MRPMTMRQLLTTLAALVLPVCVMAQARIAVVDSRAALAALPEMVDAQAAITEAGERYQAEYKQMQDEFNAKYAEYQAVADDAATPATIKDRRISELQQADKAIESFRTLAEADLRAQRDALMQPLRDRVKTAITRVGDEGHYDLVIDIATTDVPYIGATTTDITQQVKAMLTSGQ